MQMPVHHSHARHLQYRQCALPPLDALQNFWHCLVEVSSAMPDEHSAPACPPSTPRPSLLPPPPPLVVAATSALPLALLLAAAAGSSFCPPPLPFLLPFFCSASATQKPQLLHLHDSQCRSL